MKKQFSKFLSLLMATLLVFSVVPAALTAFAFDVDGVLTLDEEYVIEATDDQAYLTFTPTEADYYIIYSEGTYDLVGTLYNGETQIGYDDDDGIGNNFQIATYLTANTEYTLNVRRFSGSEYNCSVFVKKVEGIQNFEIEQGDGVSASVLGYFELNVKMTGNDYDINVQWEYDNEYLSLSSTTGYKNEQSAYFVAKKAGTTTVKASCGNLKKTVTVTIEECAETKLGTVKNIIIKDASDYYVTKYTIAEDGWYNLSYSGENYAYFAIINESTDFSFDGIEIDETVYLNAGSYYLAMEIDNAFSVTEYTFQKGEVPADSVINESKFLYDEVSMGVDNYKYLEFRANQECWFESSDSNIVYVYSDGEIYAEAIGEATVTMYGYDENGEEVVLDTVKVTVTDIPEIKLDTKINADFGNQSAPLYKFVAPADGEYIFSTGDVVGGSDSFYHEIYVYNEEVDEEAYGYINGLDLAVELNKDEVVYIRCYRNSDNVESYSLVVRNGYKPLTSLELMLGYYDYYDSETDTYYYSLGDDLVEAYGSSASDTPCFPIYFEYDGAFDYDADYTVTAVSGDKNVISDRDDVYGQNMSLYLEGVGETTLTVTYKDNETGKEFSDKINVVVLSDIENDVNNDNVFDEFDVGALIDILESGEVRLPEYVRTDIDGDHFLTEKDILAGIKAICGDESDKNAPAVEGVKNGESYTENKTVSVSGQDIESVTINGKEIQLTYNSDEENGYKVVAEMEIELTEEDSEYTVVATDVNGNKTTVTFTMAGNFTLGDVNNSGDIDMMDYILIKRNYFGTFQFTDAQIKAGDVNKSGAIDMMDYILIKRAYFGTFTLA